MVRPQEGKPPVQGELSPEPPDTFIRMKQTLHSHPAYTEDHPRLKKDKLPVQERGARGDFLGQRIPVMGRPAFYYIGNEAVPFPG
jgi:hypothetical protein